LKYINHFHPYVSHHHPEHHQTNVTPPHKKQRGVSPPPRSRARNVASGPTYGSLDTLSTSPSIQQPKQENDDV